jgi:hypothetical protein
VTSRLAIVCAVLAAGGCDQLFGLDRVPPTPTCVYSQDPLDEDCDAIANDVDPCPAELKGGSADADGDGVGNACDPSGELEHRVLFDGFTDNSHPWVQNRGGWKFMGGALANTAGDGEITIPIATTRPTAQIFVDQITTSVDNASLTLFGGDQGARVRCSLVFHMPGNSQILTLDVPFVGTITAPVVGSGLLRLELGQFPDNKFRCRAHYADDPDVEIVQPGASAVTATIVGLTASGLFAQFDSITLVGL